MHTPAHHAQYSSSKIPPSRGDLEFNNDKQDGFAYLCLLMFHRYVHLKQPPFSNITMFGNHESHCGMNGGFTYIQVLGCQDEGHVTYCGGFNLCSSHSHTPGVAGLVCLLPLTRSRSVANNARLAAADVLFVCLCLFFRKTFGRTHYDEQHTARSTDFAERRACPPCDMD